MRELLGGTTENNILSDEGSFIYPPRQINDFSHEAKREKIELETGPVQVIASDLRRMYTVSMSLAGRGSSGKEELEVESVGDSAGPPGTPPDP